MHPKTENARYFSHRSRSGLVFWREIPIIVTSVGVAFHRRCMAALLQEGNNRKVVSLSFMDVRLLEFVRLRRFHHFQLCADEAREASPNCSE